MLLIFFFRNNNTFIIVCHYRAIEGNQIEYLPDNCFRENKKLTRLRLKDNPITAVGKNTFSHMPALEEL